MKKILLSLTPIVFFMCFILFGVCSCKYDWQKPAIKVKHSPIIATSSEQVTYTVTVLSTGDSPASVELFIGTALVQTFNNVTKGQTYSFTGGPYPNHEKGTIAYRATITSDDNDSETRGYYYFAITDNNYDWINPNIPARYTGSHNIKEDIVFHHASDYSSFSNFVDDVGDKVWDVYGEQEYIEAPDFFDNFNFYIYRNQAQAIGCGQVHGNCNTDMPWRDVDAILHVAEFGDCARIADRTFTAEGPSTQSFLHESGHAVFGLSDEYDGNTAYFMPAVEPNIWPHETIGLAEQITKGRDPKKVWRFTTNQGGWWGIHDKDVKTVMMQGWVGEPWGKEASERVIWYFSQF